MSADIAGCHNRAVQWVETRNAAEPLTRQRTASPPPQPWQPLSCQKVNSADVEKLRSLVIMYDLTVKGACDKMSLLSYHFLIHYMSVGGTEVNTFEKHLLSPPPHPSPHQPLCFPLSPADLTAHCAQNLGFVTRVKGRSASLPLYLLTFFSRLFTFLKTNKDKLVGNSLKPRVMSGRRFEF